MDTLWMTDIHLDHLGPDARNDFYIICRDAKPERIFITGDIGVAGKTVGYLEEMEDVIEKPIYFVLGNHDYYHGSVESVRDEMRLMTKGFKRPWMPNYLTINNSFLIGDGIAVTGVDGFADCKVGDPSIILNQMTDHHLIEDFNINKITSQDMIRARKLLSKYDTGLLKSNLDELREHPDVHTIYVLTHVPPFVESSPCYRYGNNHGLPYYTNLTLGEMLKQWAEDHPNIKLEVLCGHTHLACEYRAAPNLRVRSLKATYGKPHQCMQMITI